MEPDDLIILIRQSLQDQLDFQVSLKTQLLAAVLIPIVPRAEGLKIIFTLRQMDLKHHPGQICFPGGQVDSTDPNFIATALREAKEEIGLNREQIELLGYLPPVETISEPNFVVIPIVSLVNPPTNFQRHAKEVAEIFEVPLPFLLDPKNYTRHWRIIKGKRRYYYLIQYKQYQIWGLTAKIAVNLRKLFHKNASLDKKKLGRKRPSF